MCKSFIKLTPVYFTIDGPPLPFYLLDYNICPFLLSVYLWYCTFKVSGIFKSLPILPVIHDGAPDDFEVPSHMKICTYITRVNQE